MTPLARLLDTMTHGDDSAFLAAYDACKQARIDVPERADVFAQYLRGQA